MALTAEMSDTAEVAPSVERWQGACNRKMEVARIPAPVVPGVHKRLLAVAMYLDDVLEPEDLQRVFSMFAGIVHQVSIGAKSELVDKIRRRALKMQLQAEDEDDLLAAAELVDTADEFALDVLNESGKA